MSRDVRRGLCRTGYVAECGSSAVRIEFGAMSACANCSAGLGCGIGPIVGLLQAPASYTVGRNEPGADKLRIGDAVRMQIGATQLIGQVGLVYCLPLVGLIAGAVGASWGLEVASDFRAVVGAGIGLALASGFARLVRSAIDLDAGLRPRITSSSV